MDHPFSFSYPRYLEVKTTVDERSLNQKVWTAFLDHLEAGPSSPTILDVGGGTGATLLRVLEAMTDRSIIQIDYTLLDPEEEIRPQRPTTSPPGPRATNGPITWRRADII